MIRLVVNGAHGRMGQRICALARNDAHFELIAALGRDSSAQVFAEIQRKGCDLVIDFSSDEGAAIAAELAAQCHAALLVGTTALSPRATAKIEVCATSIPTMIAPNTSRGVAVLCHLIAEAARLLGDEFDIDIIDVHHSAKRDAPSGTALRLTETLKQRAGVELPPDRIHALRAGDVIGDHEVTFAGTGERLKILHSATSRDLFAHGALRAGAWLTRQKPGMYSIEQSLGLNVTA